MKYYICGTIGTGTAEDPFRPEIADDLALLGKPAIGNRFIIVDGVRTINPDYIPPVRVNSWGSSQEIISLLPPTEGERQIVTFDGIDEFHNEVGYSAENPNGYDWFDVNENNEVTLYAKE